jgi:hypothetical protein
MENGYGVWYGCLDGSGWNDFAAHIPFLTFLTIHSYLKVRFVSIHLKHHHCS